MDGQSKGMEGVRAESEWEVTEPGKEPGIFVVSG